MHRDVKPHNIMIDHSQRKLRLIDWGLAEVRPCGRALPGRHAAGWRTAGGAAGCLQRGRRPARARQQQARQRAWPAGQRARGRATGWGCWPQGAPRAHAARAAARPNLSPPTPVHPTPSRSSTRGASTGMRSRCIAPAAQPLHLPRPRLLPRSSTTRGASTTCFLCRVAQSLHPWPHPHTRSSTTRGASTTCAWPAATSRAPSCWWTCRCLRGVLHVTLAGCGLRRCCRQGFELLVGSTRCCNTAPRLLGGWWRDGGRTSCKGPELLVDLQAGPRLQRQLAAGFGSVGRGGSLPRAA